MNLENEFSKLLGPYHKFKTYLRLQYTALISLPYMYVPLSKPILNSFGIGHAKFINPPTDGFIRNINATFSHHIFDITETQVKAKIKLDGFTNNGWK